MFYIGAKDANGDYVDQFGSKKMPASLQLAENGSAPAYPNQAPMTRCADAGGQDCPPDFPGCEPAQPEQTCGDLGIKQRLRQAVMAEVQYFQILPAGMHDGETVVRHQDRPQTAGIEICQHINTENPVPGRDLYQAEYRCIGVGAHEFRIHAEDSGFRQKQHSSIQFALLLDHADVLGRGWHVRRV